MVLFLISYVNVLIKVIQGRNFAFDNYIMVVPTSLVLAAMDMWIISNIAQFGYGLVIVLEVGFGSGLGAVTGMYIHKRWIKKENL